jgi:hypothetical protein
MVTEIAVNPYGSAVAETAGARQLQARENTEVLALVYAAKQNPRNPAQSAERIRNAFTRAGLAEQAEYAFVRGGTNISGPSIRAAEAMRLEWGNLSAGWRELQRVVGADGVGSSEVEAYCIDYETGNREAIQFWVRHWRDTKQGGYKLREERDIYELCANQAQRRKRGCIIGLLPGDVVEMAMQQAGLTLKAKADTSPEAMAKMLEAFAPWSISRAMIEKRIQRSLDAIQPANVIALKRIYASLRDEMSSPEDWFDTGAQVAVVATEIKRKREKAAAPVAPVAPVEKGSALQYFLDQLQTAPDANVAGLILDEASSKLAPAELAELASAYAKRWSDA